MRLVKHLSECVARHTRNTVRTGIPTAQGVSCVTKDPSGATSENGMLPVNYPQLAALQTGGGSEGPLQPAGAGMAKSQSGTTLDPHATAGEGQTVSDVAVMPANYTKFTSQTDLGHFLMDKYHIRTANELSSCEVCHR